MRNKLYLVGLVLISLLLMWLPFVLGIVLPLWGIDFKEGMNVVFANFDGPNYLIIAKTWYDKQLIAAGFSNPLPLEYYPAHLPFYPFTIWVLDMVLPGTWAMLVSSMLGTILAVLIFYEFLEEYKIGGPFFISMVFLFLPARWLAVRTIGSPEPWFIFFILSSLLAFKRERYLLAGMMGALAQLTKSPGILLFVGYGVYFLKRYWETRRFEMKLYLKSAPLILIPLVVLPLFYFYSVRTGDFWAYFNSGDNFHLFFPPFSIFSPKGQYWTGEFWLEEVIYIWGIYGLAVINLWKKKMKLEASFAGVFWLSTLFVAHRDIARYILPIFPLMLIGWEDILNRKEFRILAAVLIIPAMLYSWGFMLNNMAPVADWTPYL